MKDTYEQNSHSFVHFLCSLPDVSAGRFARGLWWTSQGFSSAGIVIIIIIIHHHGSPRSYTTRGMNNRLLVSEIQRHRLRRSTKWENVGNNAENPVQAFGFITGELENEGRQLLWIFILVQTQLDIITIKPRRFLFEHLRWD